MKKIILLTLFVYSIINVHAQIDLTKIEREYLPEIQVDSAFFRMLDSILTDELKESRNRNDFNYDVLLLLDQHGNHCAQIAPAGVRVPNVVGEKDTYSIWGIMDYNDHSFLFRGVYIDEVVDISDKMIPFDFAVDQTQFFEDGSVFFDDAFFDDYSYGLWLFRHENDKWVLVKRIESLVD